MKHILTILVDALRYDYLSEENTPFLYSISKQGFQAPLQPILGFSDAIRATLFTGTYPNVHNYWIMYRYSPETSPFKIFRPFKFIDRTPSDLLKRGLKFVLSSTLCKVLGVVYDYHELSTHNIPFKGIHYFDYTSKRSMLSPRAFNDLHTIFDVFRDHNIKFTYLDSSKLGGRLLSVCKGLDQDVQVVMVYLDYLDFAAHRYGLNSPRFWNMLRNTDEVIKSIVNIVKQRLSDELNLIIFSDHGMVEGKGFLKFEQLVRDKKFGTDYLFFLDSTMVRLWYLNPDIKEDVRRTFGRLHYGAFLSEEEKKGLKINFNHRYYGDDIYLLKPGYIIFPNFVSWLKPKAMHAYHPKYESQLGIFLSRGEELSNIDRDTSFVKLVDVMPTILDVMDLEVPKTCESRSLLRR